MKVEIIRKNIKNINIKVKADGTVGMSVPIDTTNKYIETILKKREFWINKQLDFFKRNYSKEEEKEYVNGETVKYLGKNYRLKVLKSKDERVSLYRGFIYIYTNFPENTIYKKNLLKCWYIDKANIKFADIINGYLPKIGDLIHSFSVKTMKSKWGDCDAQKKHINLNLKLMEKPKYCIEYVVFHELAHLIYPNHSKDFYNFMLLHMPDYKWRKDKLEEK